MSGKETVVQAIQTELKAITAVAANAQSKSSELNVYQKKSATIFIDHAKDNANAAVGAGCEYRFQASEKDSGDDTWRSLDAVVAQITAPTAVVTDNNEAAGSTVIECGAVVPAIGDIIFFKNATIALSEWARVVAVDATPGSESFTIADGLTNAQAAGTYYTQGEHYTATINTRAITRLRVVCNNANGTTNRAIVWRCAAITED